MQKLLLVCVFAVLATLTNAQDRIVTIEQDTIDCRIVSIGGERISYEQKSTGGYTVGKSIPIEQVATYFRASKPSSTIFSRRPERPWLFRVSPGGSWLPWLTDDIDDISGNGKKLAKGFHLNASGHYLINRFFGAGIQYSFFGSNAKSEYPVESYYYYPTYIMLSEKEKQYINYIGASLISQQFLDKNKKFQLSETLSAGMLFYRGESQASLMYQGSTDFYTYNNNTLITGRTFGATFGISAEYYILPSLSIGVGGDFLFGVLKKVKGEQRDSEGNKNIIESTKLDEPLKISRIDYSLSLSVHF